MVVKAGDTSTGLSKMGEIEQVQQLEQLYFAAVSSICGEIHDRIDELFAISGNQHGYKHVAVLWWNVFGQQIAARLIRSCTVMNGTAGTRVNGRKSVSISSSN